MTELRVDNVSLEIDGIRLVNEVMFNMARGEFLGLVGPNGSGKSSLLRSIYRVMRPHAGSVALLGEDVWKLSARDVAARLAVVAQERMGEFDFTVTELVAMGRTPHKKMFEGDNKQDGEIIAQALATVGLSHCAKRQFLSLSGGEKQRVLVARALAQQAPFLVLDEPTNHLDIRHQLDLLGLVARLPVTTLAALHDLNLAARYCDRLVMLKEGCVVAVGTPAEVLTKERIAEVYEVGATVVLENGIPRVDFYPLELAGVGVAEAAE